MIPTQKTDLALYTTVLAILFAILWNLSAMWRYYAKYFIFGLTQTLILTIPIPLMLLRPRNPRNGIILAHIVLWSSRLLGLKIILEGEENLIKDNASIVVINHQSMLDVYVMAKLWSLLINCTIIAKRELLLFQPFALGAWLVGVIFINRKNKKSAKEIMNKTGELIQEKKRNVIIFPEGTRNFTDNWLLPLKKGAFYLAVSSKCAIQPVAVSKYNFLKTHQFNNGCIKIRVLPPISVDKYKKENFDELVDKTREVLISNIAEISK